MIKRIAGPLNLFCLILFTSLTLRAQSANITGKWEVTRDNKPTSSLELSQSGDVVTGNWVNQDGDKSELEDGKVIGDTVTFSFNRDNNRFLATGHIRENSIEFDVQVQGQSKKIHAVAKRE